MAIEVRAAATVHADDLRHLTHLRQRIGERFHAGILLHLGTTSASFGDRLTVAPVEAL